MVTPKAKTVRESKRWELNASVYVYPAIILFGGLFVYILYRAATIIRVSNSQINPRFYFETHFITIILEIVLWVIIARAAMRLKSYVLMVIDSSDGQALDYIANALLMSLLYAISFGMASTVKTLFWHTPYLRSVTTVTNFFPLIIILFSSILLLVGSFPLLIYGMFVVLTWSVS